MMECEIIAPKLLEPTKQITALWIGRLGDLIVSTPLLRALRVRFPRARITLVVGAKGTEAARLIPDVGETLALGRAWDLPAHLRLARRLFARPIDLLIDLNSAYSKTSALLARAARARVKLAFRTRPADRVHTHLLAAPDEREPMLDRYARMARALGAPFDPMPRVRPGPADVRRADEILRTLGCADARWIAVHPGNFKKFDNRWPEERLVELTDRLLDLGGWRLAYLAGPGEEAPARAIAARLRRPVPVVPPQPVGVTAALLARMDLFLGNCTGTTHLAVAVGTPTFTILSGYTKTVWMPYASPHACVASDSWTSCRDIPVETAWRALRDALQTLRRPAAPSQDRPV